MMTSSFSGADDDAAKHRRLSTSSAGAVVSQTPPPKPAKSDRVTAFAESLLRPKEPTRASVRQLHGQRRVAELTRAFDKRSSALSSGGGGGLGGSSSRWRSEENLCLSGHSRTPQANGGGRASIIDEDDEEELDAAADNAGPPPAAPAVTFAAPSLKPRAASTLGPGSHASRVHASSPTPATGAGGGGSTVKQRIRAFETSTRQGVKTAAQPRPQLAKQPQKPLPTITVAAAAPQHRHTVFLGEDYVYEDLRLQQGQQPKPKRSAAALSPREENVYDIAGYEMRRTASVDDLISSSAASSSTQAAAASHAGLRPEAESEYATVVVRSDRAASAAPAVFAYPATAAAAPAAAAATASVPDAFGHVGSQAVAAAAAIEPWRARVLERVADSFSTFRKLAAPHGGCGGGHHALLAAAAGSVGDSSDVEDTEDDDGSRSNVSEEVADRIRRAELTKQQNEAVLHSGLQAKRMRHDQLFSGCCLIRLELAPQLPDSEPPVPLTSFCHPATFATRDFSYALPSFCFPDAGSLAERAGHREQLRAYLQDCDKFSFVLTEQRGERYYGYCMRCLVTATSGRVNQSPGGAALVVEAVCIVTPVESEQLYYQILLEAFRKRLNAPTPERGAMEVEEFLVSVYNRPLPNAGSWFDLTTTDPARGGVVVSCRFNRPASARLQHVSYSHLLTFPGVQNTLQLFGAVLHERKIVLVSGNPRRLSQCTQALAALLYPLRWQHTLVPIVPAAMLRIVCSPTPYIVGVLASHLPAVLEDDLDDDVLIASLDDGRFVRQKGDERKLLSRKLQRAIFRSLDGNRQLEARHGAGAQMRLSELLIVETFLRFFAVLIGHYADHVTSAADGSRRRFDRDAFCAAPRSKGLRALLKVLTATGNFHVFISDVLDGSAYETNKLTVSTVLRDFDTAVAAFRQDVDKHGGGGGGGAGAVSGAGGGGGGGGLLDGFRSRMRKFFTVSSRGGDASASSRPTAASSTTGGTLSSSYPTKASLQPTKPALPPRR